MADPLVLSPTSLKQLPGNAAANPGLCIECRRAIFLTYVEEEGECWRWTGYIDPHGYGQLGTNIKAHRLAHELFNGPIPDGFLVRHTCDNRWCVQPAHLLTGTVADNVADAMARGRKIGRPRVLTAPQIAEVWRLRKSRLPIRAIAEQMGVSSSTIGRLLHVEGGDADHA